MGNQGKRPNMVASDLINKAGAGMVHLFFPYAPDMILIISLNIVAFILETEIKFYENYRIYFYWFEIFSIAIFTIEYILRLYTCNSEKKI